MDTSQLNILIFGHTDFGTKGVSIRKEMFKILSCLLIFLQFSFTFFLCDYIQLKKKNFLLNHLRQESLAQKSEIHFFSAKIEELENKIARLRVLDKRIRVIANLERGQETIPFIGMGEPSPFLSSEEAKGNSRENIHPLQSRLNRNGQ
jgi:hypothetical protein